MGSLAAVPESPDSSERSPGKNPPQFDLSAPLHVSSASSKSDAISATGQDTSPPRATAAFTAEAFTPSTAQSSASPGSAPASSTPGGSATFIASHDSSAVNPLQLTTLLDAQSSSQSFSSGGQAPRCLPETARSLPPHPPGHSSIPAGGHGDATATRAAPHATRSRVLAERSKALAHAEHRDELVVGGGASLAALLHECGVEEDTLLKLQQSRRRQRAEVLLRHAAPAWPERAGPPAHALAQAVAQQHKARQEASSRIAVGTALTRSQLEQAGRQMRSRTPLAGSAAHASSNSAQQPQHSQYEELAVALRSVESQLIRSRSQLEQAAMRLEGERFALKALARQSKGGAPAVPSSMPAGGLSPAVAASRDVTRLLRGIAELNGGREAANSSRTAWQQQMWRQLQAREVATGGSRYDAAAPGYQPSSFGV